MLACGDMRKRNVKDFPWSNAEFFDFRDFAKSSFEQFAVVRTGRATIPRDDGASEQVRVAAVTPNFFRMMGGAHRPGPRFHRIGRHSAARSATQPTRRRRGPAPPARGRRVELYLLPTPLRRRSLRVLGRTIFTGGPVVVGVLAPGFELLFPPDANMEQSPDYWISGAPWPTMPRNATTFPGA